MARRAVNSLADATARHLGDGVSPRQASLPAWLAASASARASDAADAAARQAGPVICAAQPSGSSDDTVSLHEASPRGETASPHTLRSLGQRQAAAEVAMGAMRADSMDSAGCEPPPRKEAAGTQQGAQPLQGSAQQEPVTLAEQLQGMMGAGASAACAVCGHAWDARTAFDNGIRMAACTSA